MQRTARLWIAKTKKRLIKIQNNGRTAQLLIIKNKKFMKKENTFLRRMLYLAFVACVGFAACSDDDGGSDKPDDPDVPDQPGDTATVITSVATLPEWTAEAWLTPEGKAAFTDEDGVQAAWGEAADEAFTAFKEGALTEPIDFRATQGEGTSMTFESESEVDSPAGTYYVAYPEATDAGAVEIDLTGQDGTLQDGKMYMAATATCTEEGKMDFAFTNLTAILKFELTLPETCTGPILNADLSATGLVTKTTADITKSPVEYSGGATAGNINCECRLDVVPGTNLVTAYFHVLPGSLSNVMLMLTDGAGEVYVFDFLGEVLDVEAGKVYTKTTTYVSPEEELTARLYGTWAWTAYIEDGYTYPKEEFPYYYDPATAAGSYYVLRGDGTCDYPTVNADKSGSYYSYTWRVERMMDEDEGKEYDTLILTETSGNEQVYRILELTDNTMHVLNIDSWGSWKDYPMEWKFQKVSIDPITDEGFSLEPAAGGM